MTNSPLPLMLFLNKCREEYDTNVIQIGSIINDTTMVIRSWYVQTENYPWLVEFEVESLSKQPKPFDSSFISAHVIRWGQNPFYIDDITLKMTPDQGDPILLVVEKGRLRGMSQNMDSLATSYETEYQISANLLETMLEMVGISARTTYRDFQFRVMPIYGYDVSLSPTTVGNIPAALEAHLYGEEFTMSVMNGRSTLQYGMFFEDLLSGAMYRRQFAGSLYFEIPDFAGGVGNIIPYIAGVTHLPFDQVNQWHVANGITVSLHEELRK